MVKATSTPSVQHQDKFAQDLREGEVLVRIEDSAGNVWTGRRLVCGVEVEGKHVRVQLDSRSSEPAALWYSDKVRVKAPEPLTSQTRPEPLRSHKSAPPVLLAGSRCRTGTTAFTLATDITDTETVGPRWPRTGRSSGSTGCRTAPSSKSRRASPPISMTDRAGLSSSHRMKPIIPAGALYTFEGSDEVFVLAEPIYDVEAIIWESTDGTTDRGEYLLPDGRFIEVVSAPAFPEESP